MKACHSVIMLIIFTRRRNNDCSYLRKLKSFDVSQHILQLVYRGLIESVLTFNRITWHGNVSGKNKTKLARVVNTASKLIGNEQKHLYSI